MKKLVIGATAMGGAALIAFGASGTFAAVSDTSTENLSAGAGTLTVGIDRPATAPASAGNLAPGGSVVVPFFVKNTGNNVTGKVGVALGGVKNQENSCSSVSERTAENGACDTWDDTGEFSSFATYRVAASAASQYQCNATATPSAWVPFTLASGMLPSASPITLTPGSGQCVLVEITLPKTADNKVQGDSMSFDAVVTLESV
jgi:Camelysin metallo-endopeptidase